MTRVNVPIEMNEDLYDKMQELCEELGLDMDTAIGIFAQKMVNEEGMPFEVTEQMVASAILVADKTGRAYKEAWGK